MQEVRSDTGKTIDDYREIIKKLKLKIKIQEDKNQQLQQEYDQLQSNIEPNMIDHIIDKLLPKDNQGQLQESPDDLLMNKFFTQAQKIGLTLEMIFRAADKQKRNFILLDEFRLFISKIKLNLSQVEIHKLVQIFDDDCSETLKKDEYYQTLITYGVNTEQEGKFMQEIGINALIRFQQQLESEHTKLETAWKRMTRDENDFITLEDLIRYFMSIDPQVTKKECVALFIYIDIPNSKKIGQELFMTTLSQGLRSSSQPTAQLDKPALMSKFQNITSHHLIHFYQTLLLNLQNPQQGILFANFVLTIPSYANCLSQKELFYLFKSINKAQNGLISFSEINQELKEELQGDVFWVWLGKKLQSEDIDTQSYLVKQGVKSLINKDNFGQTMSGVLNNAETLFEKSFKEQIKLDTLVDLINSYRNDIVMSQQQNYISMIQDKLKFSINMNDKKDIRYIESQAQKFKREIDPSDFFIADNRTYKTIFTNQFACFRQLFFKVRCLQIAQGLIEKNLTQWTDFEFGPQDECTKYNGIFNFDNNSSIFSREILWQRFQSIDMSKPNYLFGPDGPHKTKIQQGSVENQWLLNAFSLIANRNYYFFVGDMSNTQSLNEKITQFDHGLFPALFHCFQQIGIYVVKLFKTPHSDNPIYILLDSQLPMSPLEQKLLFCSSINEQYNEYWPSILEKAFAKLYGCYYSLNHGHMISALSDLTGLPIQSIKPDYDYLQKKFNKKVLQEKVFDKNEDWICCGLGMDQIWVVKDVKPIKKEGIKNLRRLLLLKGEKINAWEKWNELAGNDQNLKKEIEDDQFLMGFKAWRNTMEEMILLQNIPDKWIQIRLYDHWGKGKKSGFPRDQSDQQLVSYAENNNQYLIKAQNPTRLIITAKQYDGRFVKGLEYPFEPRLQEINIMLFHDPQNKKILSSFEPSQLYRSSGRFISSSSICLSEVELAPGSYICIVSTYDQVHTAHDYTVDFIYDDYDLLVSGPHDQQIKTEYIEETKIDSQLENTFGNIIEVVQQFVIDQN